MTPELMHSYRACETIARDAASSFFWCFRLLPPPQRRAMHALYAFARHTDDLGDSPQSCAVRTAALVQWRRQVEEALAGRFEDDTLPALVHTVRQYAIPVQYLFDIVDGVAMDLDPQGFDTFEALQFYCHRVASAVGLACLHIWGFAGESALALAMDRGVALQLTNILRDIHDDVRNGRLYLPREDLRRFDCTPAALEDPAHQDPVRALLRFEIERAESFYRRSQGLAMQVHPAGRRMLCLMTGTYWHLLQRIRRSAACGTGEPRRLTLLSKVQIVHSALCPWGNVRRERF